MNPTNHQPEHIAQSLLTKIIQIDLAQSDLNVHCTVQYSCDRQSHHLTDIARTDAISLTEPEFLCTISVCEFLDRASCVCNMDRMDKDRRLNEGIKK